MTFHSDNLPALESISDAINIGYEKGQDIRKYGAELKDMGEQMRTWQGSYVRDQYYEFWRKGFKAGYEGREKPKD